MYAMRVDTTFEKGQNIQMQAKELKNNNTFSEVMLQKVNSANWTGQPKHLRYLNAKWFATPAQKIITTKKLGFHKGANAWIFNDFAYKNGKLLKSRCRVESRHHQ